MSVVSLEKKQDVGTLLAAARTRLRQAIITHELKPGSKVSEQMLVDRYGFTKATTRAAMASLVEEGLIITKSLRMQVVAPLTLADIRSIFHLRNLLEPDVARQAAGHVDIDELNRLNDACLAAQARPASGEAALAVLLANKAFHLAIAQAGQNERQYRWIEQLQNAVMRVLWFSLRPDKSENIWDDGHRGLIEALAAGDGNKAAEIALQHLHAGERQVFDGLSRLPDFSAREISN